MCGPWACSGWAFQSLIVFGKECRCESTCTFEWGNGNFSLFILLLVLQARSEEEILDLFGVSLDIGMIAGHKP